MTKGLDGVCSSTRHQVACQMFKFNFMGLDLKEKKNESWKIT